MRLFRDSVCLTLEEAYSPGAFFANAGQHAVIAAFWTLKRTADAAGSTKPAPDRLDT